ncbi:hypothetical protein HF521_018941 [Silurus meridionalis]|uniref:Chemokine interleukin-8-like domain-containing protein n=2 Tax=Silurus meridionalis TaxID=175797 RepID=A0A8T0BN73_SILME|nr:hypothetical protein HF521_018941 [Silurus meridionalis]
MRNLTVLLFVLSLCSFHLVFSAPIAFQFKDTCCSALTKFKIPLNNIVSYRKTGSSCPLKAFIFETKALRRFCVDPKASWVKNHITAVDLRKNSKSKL